MSSKQKKFLLLLCAYIFAVCLGYSIYASAQISALEENVAELVEKGKNEVEFETEEHYNRCIQASEDLLMGGEIVIEEQNDEEGNTNE